MTAIQRLWGYADSQSWRVALALGRRRRELEHMRDEESRKIQVHDMVLELHSEDDRLLYAQPVPAESELELAAEDLLYRLAHEKRAP